MRKIIFTILVMTGLSITMATYAGTPDIGIVKKQEDIQDFSFSAAEEELWAAEDLLIQNVNIQNNSNINAYSPRITIKGDFHVSRGSTFRAGVPVFKVHFVNMVDPTNAHSPTMVIPGVGIDFADAGMSQRKFEEFCQNEIEILNYYFKSDDGKQLVKFVMKDALRWDRSMKNTNYYKCSSEGDDETDCDPGYVDSAGQVKSSLDAFNDTDFDDFRDNNTLNVVFFDNPNKKASGANYNLNNDGPPIIIIDYQRVDENLGHDHDSDGVEDDCGSRDSSFPPEFMTAAGDSPLKSLNNGIQDDDHDRRGVEPHEMGHVFGLHHVCRQHPYDSSDIWDQVMTGNLASTRPYPGETCYDYCDFENATYSKPECQHWFRTSFFSREPISREDETRGHDVQPDGIVDDYYLYIQSYHSSRALNYLYRYEDFGQAQIIMNMAYHFKGYLE